jgi:hypothetical protein
MTRSGRKSIRSIMLCCAIKSLEGLTSSDMRVKDELAIS